MMVAIRDGWPRGFDPFSCRRSASMSTEAPSLSQPRGQFSRFPRARYGADGLSIHTSLFRLSVSGEFGRGGSLSRIHWIEPGKLWKEKRVNVSETLVKEDMTLDSWTHAVTASRTEWGLQSPLGSWVTLREECLILQVRDLTREISLSLYAYRNRPKRCTTERELCPSHWSRAPCPPKSHT